MIKVSFKKLTLQSVAPVKAHPTDAGFDLTAITKEVTEDYIEYDTGISIKLPKKHCGLLLPRSSNSNKDLLLCNSVGLIDEDYTGSLRFRFKRTTKTFKTIFKSFWWFSKLKKVPIELKEYEVGDKIGQLVILPIPEIELVEEQELPITSRGTNGFGSTDKPKPNNSRKKKIN
ncbi:hypothetical protein [Clostridium sp.]|uniref:dUTP diphosphatase n=1 Tax=Clostridium sp. TaxID=1506 RepID=UPI002FC96B1D